MTSATNADMAQTRAALVQANHILAHHGVVDAFGHVSARHPERGDRFLISRSMPPAAVTDEDLMVVADDGEPAEGEARRPFLERFIHSAMYRARPDVGAIVHSHCANVIAFSVVPGAPLRPIFHMAGFIGSEAPVFEIRDAAGDASDMLVRNAAIGERLAQCLGGSAAVLMRGHGSTCVGQDIKQAVFRAIYLTINAQIQSQATLLGVPTFLNAAEAANADAANSSQIERAWALWCSQISPQVAGV